MSVVVTHGRDEQDAPARGVLDCPALDRGRRRPGQAQVDDLRSVADGVTDCGRLVSSGDDAARPSSLDDEELGATAEIGCERRDEGAVPVLIGDTGDTGAHVVRQRVRGGDVGRRHIRTGVDDRNPDLPRFCQHRARDAVCSGRTELPLEAAGCRGGAAAHGDALGPAGTEGCRPRRYRDEARDCCRSCSPCHRHAAY